MMHVTVEYPKRANITVKLPAVPRAFINTDHGPKGDPGATGPRGFSGAVGAPDVLANRPPTAEVGQWWVATDAVPAVTVWDGAGWLPVEVSKSRLLARYRMQAQPVGIAVGATKVLSAFETPDFVMPNGIIQVVGGNLLVSCDVDSSTVTAALVYSTDSGTTWNDVRILNGTVPAFSTGDWRDILLPAFEVDNDQIAAALTVRFAVLVGNSAGDTTMTYLYLPPSPPSLTVTGPM